MTTPAHIHQRILRGEHRRDAVFSLVGLLVMLVIMWVLAALFVRLVIDGAEHLNLAFLLNYPSRHADQAGILAAWVGSVLVLLVTAMAAVPLGVAAGIYLEEYAQRGRWSSMLEISIGNLAGVPSIVYGLLALGLLVQGMHLGQSILSAGLTLAMLILPMVIVSTREALRTVPVDLREASLALGASRWQTVWHHVLPQAMPGILTGVILGLSRAIGETAPVIVIGALSFLSFLPAAPISATPPFVNLDWLYSPFTVLPIQVFHWISRPNPDFHANAAAAGVVLVVLNLAMNALALVIRQRARRRQFG
ncbi:MAG: phosphate ABC transporter permease PstA [Lysobacteraceae bacterium]